ncbi:penicillin-binding protein 1A [Parapedobacter indicus]|uniref:Penicillin-binding protein 1A n=2 Tax=Parapedobacter indicus TaxID=1477437 RepID=A0A1I3R2T5_9SPHI|nr:transglycosylase domain-containing protein [Parapedobacter indicus]PPL00311.1 penicillin-binding protein 1A [Parapedobacter indicus]SFJ39687.1 penicillin-binding protein 1A [Parapedobacter indicus]
MFKEIRNRYIRYAVIIIYSLIMLICAVEVNFLWLFGYSPTSRDISKPIQSIASEVYTADSVLIGRYFEEDRSPVPYDSISPDVVNALIATEDIRFFKHHGVDFWAIFSSIVSTAQGDRRGGSTITQQLAKNLYRTRYNQSIGLLGEIPGVHILVVKFKEWMTAYKLESQYTKKEIITMYLNTVSFSNNAYGIKTVARRYFSKEAGDLTAAEAAVLIGMLKGTTLYNPIRNPDRSQERRNVVLTQMHKAGFLSDITYNDAKNAALGLRPGEIDELGSGDSYLRTAVERWLVSWCEENGYDIYVDGLKIYTTIDSRVQQHAEDAVSEQMKPLQQRLENAWQGEQPWRDAEGNVIDGFLEKLAERTPYYQQLVEKYADNRDSIYYYLNLPKTMEVFTWEGPKEVHYSTLDSLAHYATMLNAGLMSMDPYNGEIKAWVGGINHHYYKYDHVFQSKRQAGSTFKPFAYLAALEAGKSPCDKYTDKFVRIVYTENGEEKIWEPKNADWVFSGREMSLRWAMGRSVNSITAQITEEVGWDKVVDAAHRCGITSPLASVPSVSLGSNDVSVFEMVNAYATFMNRGRRVEPVLVSKIVDYHGKTVATFKTTASQAISEEVAWLMGYMLRGSMEEPEGTSQGLWEWDLWKNNNQIGGKTGTSSDYVDGWYMGVTKDLVTGVWIGCDERSIHFRNSQTGEGSRTALPVFGRFMERVYHDDSLAYGYGPFPDATVAITRKYNCPSPRTPRPDSLSLDSLAPLRLPDTPLEIPTDIEEIEKQLEIVAPTPPENRTE